MAGAAGSGRPADRERLDAASQAQRGPKRNHACCAAVRSVITACMARGLRQHPGGQNDQRRQGGYEILVDRPDGGTHPHGRRSRPHPTHRRCGHAAGAVTLGWGDGGGSGLGSEYGRPGAMPRETEWTLSRLADCAALSYDAVSNSAAAGPGQTPGLSSCANRKQLHSSAGLA